MAATGPSVQGPGGLGRELAEVQLALLGFECLMVGRAGGADLTGAGEFRGPVVTGRSGYVDSSARLRMPSLR
ncbi:hypothetical protein LV75_000916 [Actinokineospora diospyrosa]|uniref:Uncharacterized protein n=1 Tax=Actinokineospora diospyrosa TaxID=103728 RepID=A0ABT1I737_9PSEU|nr:hypothetical protein [Actinokineospora diospyrosa]